MSNVELAYVVIGLGVAVTLWAESFRYRHGDPGTTSPVKVLAKGTASTGFLALAVFSGALGSSYGKAVLIALVWSWIGDMALLGRSRVAFMAGLAAFLVGHLGFAAAFVVRGVDPMWVAAATPELALAAYLVFRWLRPNVPPPMRPAVLAYVVVITAMVILAVGTKSWWLVAAASAFWASDISVARDRFTDAGFVNRLWGLPAYYAAQVMFAVSVGMT